MAILALEPRRTFGRLDLERDYGNLALSLTAYEPSVLVPNHRHGEPYLCLVVEGEFREQAGAVSRHCRAGTLLAHPAGTVHEDCFGPEGGLCLNLFPKESWIAAYGRAFPFDRALSCASAQLESIGRNLVRELRAPDAATPLAVEALVLEALSVAIRSEWPDDIKVPSWLPKVMDRIDRSEGADLDLAALARAAGVSATHLARVIRGRFHMSVGAYVRERRLISAREMVLHSRVSLAEIALATGFYDQSHFTKAFKLRFGVPPSALRRAAVLDPGHIEDPD
jgi:AraC family transcriptional regulator